MGHYLRLSCVNVVQTILNPPNRFENLHTMVALFVNSIYHLLRLNYAVAPNIVVIYFLCTSRFDLYINAKQSTHKTRVCKLLNTFLCYLPGIQIIG